MLWKCGAYHTEVLYKIREDDVIKKTKEKKRTEVSCVFQNCPLSSRCRGEVFKKAFGVFKKSPSLSSYCLRLRQECLPKLYELEYNQSEKKTKRLLKLFFTVRC